MTLIILHHLLMRWMAWTIVLYVRARIVSANKKKYLFLPDKHIIEVYYSILI
jgi:hypothetical protein